jgi:dTDP-4-dehydrorhamnose 3,5-epimerase-like enzyme
LKLAHLLHSQDEFDLVETVSKGSFGTVYKAVRKGESTYITWLGSVSEHVQLSSLILQLRRTNGW